VTELWFFLPTVHNTSVFTTYMIVLPKNPKLFKEIYVVYSKKKIKVGVKKTQQNSCKQQKPPSYNTDPHVRFDASQRSVRQNV